MKEKFTDIVVLTDNRYVNPIEINDYNKTVLLEDQLVVDALKNEGLNVIDEFKTNGNIVLTFLW